MCSAYTTPLLLDVAETNRVSVINDHSDDYSKVMLETPRLTGAPQSIQVLSLSPSSALVGVFGVYSPNAEFFGAYGNRWEMFSLLTLRRFPRDHFRIQFPTRFVYLYEVLL